MSELQRRLSAAVTMLILMLTLVFAGGSTIAHAQYIPDRCPEPCEIGGKHVSEDYQRLTTPFHIRNGDSGGYLMVDDRSVSAKPLVQNDDRFLWVLLPGPELRNANGDVSDIIKGNGFEKKFYKLVNLKYSRALMMEAGWPIPTARATDLGDDQFWLFQKDPRDTTNSKYLIYNPKVEVPKNLRFSHLFTRAEVDASTASKATMPALLQTRGGSIRVKTGADFGAAGFLWKFEEAHIPRDLARLTIRSVKALQVSTGRSSDTDALVDSIKFAVEYGPMLVQPATAASKAANKAIKKVGKKVGKYFAGRAAKKAAKEGTEKIAKKSAFEIFKSGAKAAKTKAGTMTDALSAKIRLMFTKSGSEVAVKESLSRRVASGAYTVGAAPFRGMSWLAKKTGSAATKGSKTLIKLGRTASRKTSDVAKKGYAKLKKLARESLEEAVKKGQKKKSELVAFLNDQNKVDEYIDKLLLKTATKTLKYGVVPVLRSRLKLTNDPDKIYANNFNDLSQEMQDLSHSIPTEYEKEILAHPRIATYSDDIAISAENYRICSDTKTYAVPQKNPPYFRIASSQNMEAMSQGAKTLFETLEGTDGDAAAKQAGMTALNLALDPATTLINEIMIGEILRAADKVDDDLQIRINNRSVWPNGGGDDHRAIGTGHAPLNVGVEYLFRRGDDITINLIEWDVGGPFGSGDDSLGNLTIPTHQLYDIEEYEGVYIQQTSEGSLYQIDFVIEPLYVPTHAEIARKKRHDVECESILRQARAEEFAEEVETVRIEGRIAMVREFDYGRKTGAKDHLRAFEHTVGWANEQSCPTTGNYSELLNGEWRVGRFNKYSEKDRSVTWTNTFNDSDYGKTSDWGIGGDIVTPSQDGKWRTDSQSSARHVTKNVPREYEVQTRNGLEIDTRWKPAYLGIQESSIDVKDTDDTCEIYAMMYDGDGVLGGIGSIRDREEERTSKNGWTLYDVIDTEIAIAMRGRSSGSKFNGTLYQIADPKSITHQAVNFLKDYYEYMPENKFGVDANLRVAASGPAEFWYEKINVADEARARRRIEETSAVIEKVKKSITGAWEIGPYSQEKIASQSPLLPKTQLRANPKYPEKAKARHKRIWTFTEDGVFIEKPAYDFWFKLPVYGTWKYIGDQRIEVRTNIPVKIPANAKLAVGDKPFAEVNIGPNVGLNLNTGRTGDNSGVRFIVKMAQIPNKPTEFSGFYVQDSSGKKAIWSTPYHPGKSPYEVPELYSDAYFDVLNSKSSSNKAPAAYLEQRKAKAEANKAEMAAKLAALEALKSQSVCNMDSYTTINGEKKRPGDNAFSGKWRVGQYDARGEKKYGWNYSGVNTTAHYTRTFTDAERRAAIKVYEEIRKFRPEDITLADDLESAFTWNTSLPDGEYEQEWTFPERRSGNGAVTIRSRMGNNQYGLKYQKGDVAPPDAFWVDVVYDQGQGTFVMKSDSSHMPSNLRETFDLSWADNRCEGGTLTLTDDFDKYLGSNKYPVNFIYHPNGDREFYITKDDGSLYLWGLQDADKSKYTYKYGIKQLTPGQAADECPRDIGRYSSDGYPYDYYDIGMRLTRSIAFQNNGLTPLSVFNQNKPSRQSSRSFDVEPGGYFSTIPIYGGKYTVLNTKKQYTVLNHRDACIGNLQFGDFGSVIFGSHTPFKYLEIGEGFVAPPAKQTSALDARLSCGTYVSPDNSPGRPAVLEFKNNGSIPMEVFRLGSQGRKISPNGSGRLSSTNPDPYNDAKWYAGLETIVTLKPGESHKLRTMVGHAFTAIKRGNQRTKREFNKERGELVMVNRVVGDAEVCYGLIKVSEVSETINLSDELSVDEVKGLISKIRATAEDKENKRLDDLRIANNLGHVLDTNPAANTVSEGASAGTPVGLTAHSVDGDEQDTVSYTVSYPFGINAITGEVVVKSPLDREANAHHVIRVTATSSDGAVSYADFVVELEDANDFAVTQVTTHSGGQKRIFDGTTEYATEYVDILDDHKMSENIVGARVLRAFAEDKDVSDSVLFGLSDDAGGLFRINPEDGVVTTARALDYETVKKHTITVVATSTDGSQSSKTTSIVVENNNDGPVGPITDTNPIPNEVRENASDGTLVGVILRAREPDFNTDRITYSQETGTGGSRSIYVIDPVTGELTTSGLKDFDLEGKHTFAENEFARTFRARATSSDGSVSFETIEIQILDVNEFEVTPPKDVDLATNTVAEDALVGSPVGITAQARDNDATAVVTYSLSADAVGRFEINPNTGVVTVAKALDYEAAQTRYITVESWSSDYSNSRAHFEIAVTDVDEFEVGPVTDTDRSPNSTYEYRQNKGRGDPNYVGITAFANDQDVSAVVRYSLEGGRLENRYPKAIGTRSVLGSISIDVKTGQVFVWAADFETTPTLEFVVIATSGDSTSRAPFSVTVKNINEFEVLAPDDSDPAPNTVAEDSEVGTIVGLTARSRDPDGDTISFSLGSGSDKGFAIDPQTGIVTVNDHGLNADWGGTSILTIYARSSDGSLAEGRFLIKVTDVNEYAVGWNYLDRAAGVRQDAAIGESVTLSWGARDNDISDTVNYALMNSEDIPFAIDSETGDVTVSRSLSEPYVASYTLNILATSTDGSQARKDIVVPIEALNDFSISDLVDNDPAINAVDENIPVGTPVGITAFAVDDDGADTVTYSIADRNSPFGIDKTTGLVTVNGNIDHEQLATYEVELIGSSSDGSKTVGSFTIDVVDINEFEVWDVRDKNSADNSIDEYSTPGTLVGITAFANDEDGTDEVTYRLINDAGGRFVIDSVTGVVSVSQNPGELDRETMDANSSGYYNIDIAADSSDGSSINRELSIMLNDINEFDISAVIDTDDTPNEVDEFAEYGTLVGITAFSRDGDGDQDKNYVSYSIVDVDVDGLGRAFTIGQHTGVVKVTNMTNYDSSENRPFIRVLATGADGSTSEEDFNVTIRRLARWYDDPQGPRVEADYPKVSEADRNICVAADDDVYSKATFNNENAYFDCMDSYLPVIQRWYDNPQGPRVEADFPYVSEADRNICVAADDDENAPETFNNERLYFNCLERAMPTWRNNPQGPRDGSDVPYQRISEEEWAQCDAADTNINSQTYNNENAFFDCLDSFVPPIERWYDNPQGPRVEADFPGVSEEDRNICIAADDDVSAHYTFNNERAYFDCLASHVPAAPEVQKWRDNPQGPRYEEDYTAVSQKAFDYCRYYDEEPTSRTYNDENSYFDCLTSYLPADVANDPVQQPDDTFIELWRDNPQGPRYEEDFAAVAQDAFDYCRYNDEEPTSPTYNNEIAYFDCLTPYLPADVANNPVQQPDDTPIELWRDNPQGPRYEEDFAAVAQDAFDYCRYNDEEPTSPTYNNENAYFDCLTPYLPADIVNDPVQQPVDPVLPPDPVLNDAPACAREYGLEPEYSDQTVTLTFVNNSDDYIEVHQVNADGTSTQLMYLEYGQSSEVTTPRRLVHVAFDPAGNCIGAGTMKESRGKIAFGD